MKAIIIEEDRFNDLIKSIKLREIEAATVSINRQSQWTPELWKAALAAARSEMQFEFVKWAQSHGASCVPK